jgi:hypothetical protein
MSQMHCFVDNRLFAKLSVCVTPERWAQVDDPVRCLNALASGIEHHGKGVGAIGASCLAYVSDLIGCKEVPGHNQPADYLCHRRGLSFRLSEGAIYPSREIINAHAEAVFQPACRHVAKSGPSQGFAAAGRFGCDGAIAGIAITGGAGG